MSLLLAFQGGAPPPTITLRRLLINVGLCALLSLFL